MSRSALLRMLKTLQRVMSLSRLLLSVLQHTPSLPPTTTTCVETSSFSASATAVQNTMLINLPSSLEMAQFIAMDAATEAPNNSSLNSDIATL
ncbi:unnamed protein product [Arabis nemorensis]|uniref:Uncharacterized protein n=1 Tax=Arabis nemorensis TaxID=586526 RepID=A0A565AMX0_9BRAS|nr:unnamed protein product [Arabis nemorensis]